MDPIISFEPVISLIPQQDRLWCVVGIATIMVLLVATGLIQWRRAVKLKALCQEHPYVQRTLIMLDWPCPIAFLTLFLLVGMAMGVDWLLQVLMAMVGFSAGSFIEVVTTRSPVADQQARQNRSKYSTKDAVDRPTPTLVFSRSLRPAVQADNAPETRTKNRAASSAAAAPKAAQTVWRD
jgi:hypothetical protein